MNISTLGLMKKKGVLITGFDAVEREIKDPSSKVCGILLASDLSPKSKKEILFLRDKFCSRLEIAVLPAGMEETGAILGKKTGIIAVTDEGFWKSFAKDCEKL